MEAQISAATWALLLIPMLGVVVLSAVSLLRGTVSAEEPVKPANSESETAR